MPRDLFAEDRLVEEAEALRRGQYLKELRVIQDELDMMNHPGWKCFRDELERSESEALNSLIYGGEIPVEAARGRISLARHLLSREEFLQTRAAELRDKMSPTEDSDV